MRRAGFVLLAVVVLSACMGDEKASDEDGSPSEWTIVFTRGDDRRSELFVARGDGSDERRLTRGPGFKYDADWSPDGTKLAYRFEAGPEATSSAIRIVNADGTGDRSLSERIGVAGSAPSWSPGGKRIAFAGSRGAEDLPLGIYVAAADGASARRLTPKTFEAQYPAWSPDGRRIAFTAVAGSGFDIFVMNADGSGLKQLTDTPQSENWPMWAPDGELLAVHSEESGVEIMRPDGSEQRVLRLERDCGVPGNWAPRDWLLLNCILEDGRIGVGAVRPDGSGLTILLDGCDCGFAASRPPTADASSRSSR